MLFYRCCSPDLSSRLQETSEEERIIRERGRIAEERLRKLKVALDNAEMAESVAKKKRDDDITAAHSKAQKAREVSRASSILLQYP